MRSLWLTSLMLVAACGAARKVGRVLDAPDRDEWQQRRIDEAIAHHEIVIGMTKAEVRKSRGAPARSGREEFGGGKLRVWYYEWDQVYFDRDGIVVGTRAAYAR